MCGCSCHVTIFPKNQKHIPMTQNLRRVVVTGLGLVTPLGTGVTRSWSRLIDSNCAVVSTKGKVHKLTNSSYDTCPSQVAALVNHGTGDGDFNVENWVGKGVGKAGSMSCAFKPKNDFRGGRRTNGKLHLSCTMRCQLRTRHSLTQTGFQKQRRNEYARLVAVYGYSSSYKYITYRDWLGCLHRVWNWVH